MDLKQSTPVKFSLTSETTIDASTISKLAYRILQKLMILSFSSENDKTI
jgi:hypothetical protein